MRFTLDLKMNGILVFALVLVAVTALPTQTGEQDAPYRGHKLLQVTPTTENHLNALRFIENGIATADFWVAGGINSPFIFRISPEHLNTVQGIMRGEGIEPVILSDDVQELLDRPQPETKNGAAPVVNVVDNTQYHSYATIQTYLNAFLNTYRDQVYEVGTLNYKTFEGRDISFITLRTGSNRPVVFMECGIHAREWISPAVCLYWIDRLLVQYSQNDPNARELLDTYEFVVVPVSNPDGYEFTRGSNRLWRKNRQTFTHTGCTSSIGVDLNRNFDSQWNTVGTGTCRSDTYAGTQVFSENEAKGIREKVDSFNEISAYISLHSYSQYILTPYAFGSSVPGNINHIKSVANGASSALASVHGRNFAVGSAGDLLNYNAAGGSADWAQLQNKAPFSVTYELRPSSSDFVTGFQLPASQIIASGEEMWASLYSLIVNHNI